MLLHHMCSLCLSISIGVHCDWWKRFLLLNDLFFSLASIVQCCSCCLLFFQIALLFINSTKSVLQSVWMHHVLKSLHPPQLLILKKVQTNKEVEQIVKIKWFLPCNLIYPLLIFCHTLFVSQDTSSLNTSQSVYISYE